MNSISSDLRLYHNLPSVINDSYNPQGGFSVHNVGKGTGDFVIELISSDNFQTRNYSPKPRQSNGIPTWSYPVMPEKYVNISFTIEVMGYISDIPENTISSFRIKFQGGEYIFSYIRTKEYNFEPYNF